MRTEAPSPRVRGARAVLVAGIVLLLGGGGLTAYAVGSHDAATQELAREREAVADARSELGDEQWNLSAAKDLLESVRQDVRFTAELGRNALRTAERLVELGRTELELARDMKAAALEGRLFDYYELVDQINETIDQSNQVRRELNRLFP